jgi:predicted nucleotidyltransferase
MNIEELFSTKERIKILSKIIYSEKELRVNETAKKLGLSKGLISKYFEILVKKSILKKSRTKFIIKDNSLIKSLKIMFNIQKIDPKIFINNKFVKAVGLYGSNAKGTNTESSDVDLWIKVENAEDDKIVELTSQLRKKIENVKTLILNNKKIGLLKKKDPLFYYSLYFGSIILYGKENEI